MTDERDEAREAAIAYLREHRITPEVRAAEARRQRMLFLTGIAVTALLVAAVTAALLVLPGGSGAPVAAQQAADAEPEPHPDASATGTPLEEMHIVQGIVDLMANPRDVNELPRIAHPDQPVEGTLLSVRYDGREAIGLLTDAGRVCLWVWDAPVQDGRGICVPYDVFQQDGVLVDRGSWEVRWYADGSVVWDGL